MSKGWLILMGVCLAVIVAGPWIELWRLSVTAMLWLLVIWHLKE